MMRVRQLAKQWLGPRMTTVARVVMRGQDMPRWGNLRRTAPLSDSFGFDRGTPIDRFYLDRFLTAHRGAISGDVLEIQVPSYAQRFGTNLRDVHTLDLRTEFSPTYHCDLADAAAIVPSARYDCFLLPNTLQHLRRLEPALTQALRIVRPGGTILASAAALLRLTAPEEDFWRLTAAAWRIIADRVWPQCEIDIHAHGNCLAATAAMYGIAVEELTEDELLVQDDRFPVLVTLRCQKPLR
jgi:hypothetical protein